MRWNHPERGMIPPLDFIPLAEETGSSCRSANGCCAPPARMPPSGRRRLRFAVNLSAMQFKGRNLVQLTLNALAASGLPASRLEL
jgi:EAL domain-containing protein (putative c-di-GMP-specific phosphodiesterase class I)